MGYGAGRGGAVAVSGNNGSCCVAQGEDCTACGVGCGGGGQGSLAYVDSGQGDYIMPIVTPAPQPARPADPYNCADGFANWQAGWSVPKKEWCCKVHGKGCPNQGGGCVTSSKPYDCNAGFANW